MNILGKKVILRAIEKTDLNLLHQWSNNPKMQYTMGEIHFPSSYEFHLDWYENIRNDKLSQRFAIEVPNLGLIGVSSLINIDWKNRHAWHGVFLGDKEIRSKGYGLDAVMATMRYAFDELNLERLDGSIIEHNNLSYSFYCKKLGWNEEGRKRNYYFSGGRYWDQIIVGINKENYYLMIDKNNYWNE